MPTYDFICNTCNQRFDVFQTFSEYGKKPVNCTHCNSADVRRRMTKVRIAKSETSRMESMTDGVNNLEALENDPQALARMMRKMGGEMGEDLPPEFDDVVDRLEAGQSPEEIEAALPDLGSGDNSGDE
jgi:putative FmdB family regulatory protein